ncbi:SMI1/KNR4 family protein [Allokutzneria oryzae]|uniref:SMI1/KNR4 family protein n=1 Tax=Allokutzneria oryzae TaxID=1378989 RepID=A0ABV5ZRR4_9PSEU
MARFDDVKASFWSDSTESPPVTDEQVGEAERLLGVRLPASLVELLRVRNGGYVADAWNAFPTTKRTSWSADHVPFEQLAGACEPEHWPSLANTPYLIEEWELPQGLVLLSGDGHYWVALDYRACGPAGEPSVTWFECEADLDELPLAKDFRTFVEGLTASDDFFDETE